MTPERSVSTESPTPQACRAPPGAMSEARRDSTSSLQRKKPPWLRLDIPAVVPPATEEPGFFQVGAAGQGLGVCPVQPPHCDPTAQPLRRQAFLRSVSMPAETAHVPASHHELRRPPLQRQMSITQTIRRYSAAVVAPPMGAGGSGGSGRQNCPLWVRGLGPEPGSLLSRLSPPSCSPCHPVLLLFWGPTALTCHLPCSPPPPPVSFSVSPIPTPWPLDSRQVRSGRVHTLPLLGPPAARRALPQRRSLSRSLLRYLGQGMSVWTSGGVCMACDLLGAAGACGVPWGS